MEPTWKEAPGGRGARRLETSERKRVTRGEAAPGFSKGGVRSVGALRLTPRSGLLWLMGEGEASDGGHRTTSDSSASAAAARFTMAPTAPKRLCRAHTATYNEAKRIDG